MMKGNIGLDAAMIKSSKTILNNLLADHFVLLAKTWNYHWNMKGPSFRSYHTFLEDLYNGLIEDIDSIAERVRDLDERPIGYRSDSTPNLNYGINVAASWKGFDFAMDWTGYAGSFAGR